MNDELAAAIAASERERNRWARILHDEVGQLLTAAGLQLDVLRLDFRERVPELAQRAAEIQALLERAMIQVRELCTDTHPAMVERLGLRFALQRLTDRARLRGLPVAFEMPPGLRVPDPPAAAFYAVAARSLAYAEQRGARAVTCRVLQAADAYVLEVLYDVASPDPLESLMRLGAPVSVSSDPCGGTTIRAHYSHGIRGSAG